MKFTGTLVIPSLDVSGFQQALHKQLTAAIQSAAREWLNATAATIPVWSGASVRTFQELAAAVGFPLAVVPAAGAFTAEGSPGENTGKLTTDSSTGVYEFEYSTTLAHLVYNEYNNANIDPDPGLFFRLRHPGPYGFQERGAAVFTAQAASARLPNPFKYLKTTRLTVK
jgi:hypothetical protein